MSRCSILSPVLLSSLSLLCFISLLHLSTAVILNHTYPSGPVNLSSIATLYHNADLTSNSITLSLVITDPLILSDGESSAWVGLGIGEPASGSMLGADIVTAEFPPDVNDSCTITDRYVPWTAYPLTQPPYPFPLPDDCGIPDWDLVSCVRIPENGSVVLEVRRKILVDDGNDRQDRSIVPYENPVLYAYGPGALGFHGSRRASTRVTFYAPLEKEVHEDDVMPTENASTTTTAAMNDNLPDDVDGSFDVLNTNFSVPDGTTYACTSTLIPLPDSGERMIVAVEPLFNESDLPNRELVHHFTVYLCNGDEYAALTRNTVRCDGADGQKILGPFANSFSNCSTLVYGYAKGVNGVFAYPRQAGVPVGGRHKYIVMETHFDNPASLRLNNTNGVRIHYTNTPRQYVAGSLQTGDATVSRSHGLRRPDGTRGPPGSIISGLPYQHSCPSQCTSRFTQPLNVFTSFLHMHRTGRKISENVYHANGSYKQTLNEVNFWSDNFQQIKTFKPPLQIFPGESLQLTCVYDTTKKSNTTFGIETINEMCIDFLLFYPVQTDPITGHEINICSFLQGAPQNYTLCVDGARINELKRDTIVQFSYLVENPTLYDAIGARTNFSVPDATCAPVILPMVSVAPVPSQSMDPMMMMEEPSPSCHLSEADLFVSSS